MPLHDCRLLIDTLLIHCTIYRRQRVGDCAMFKCHLYKYNIRSPKPYDVIANQRRISSTAIMNLPLFAFNSLRWLSLNNVSEALCSGRIATNAAPSPMSCTLLRQPGQRSSPHLVHLVEFDIGEELLTAFERGRDGAGWATGELVRATFFILC